MYQWLNEAISSHAVVITASRRLARHLETRFAEQQRSEGRLAWQTPSIHYFSDWYQLQLAATADPVGLPLPIDGFSSAIIWERCIREQAPDELPAFGGVIRQAREAWQKLSDWNVPLESLRESARSPDEQLFAAAAAAYRSRLDKGGWVDREGMSQLVIGLLGNGQVRVPQAVLLAGFDRYSPSVTGVMDTLAANGCKVRMAPEPALSNDLQVVACHDHDAEMRTAGAWARDILQHSPESKVAIVCPALQNNADRTARQVREGLATGWQYAGAPWRAAVNLSYGRSLAEYPAVATALLLLRWIHRGLASADISLLLRSGCIAGPGSAGRSRLELALRMLPDRHWTPQALRQMHKGRDESADSRAWVRGLEASIALRDEAVNEASPAHWASRIDSFLAIWNWPGEQTLASDEFQLINRWRNLLNELAGTATVTPRMHFSVAVQRLATRAAEVVFQPEAELGIVELMGTLEAAGLQFDHVWVSGLHAGQWPSAGNPSPLLSRQLQRDHGMPDATPADTLKFSRRVLRRLAASAVSVVFSWPRHDGESELTPSSLLDELTCDPYAGPGDPGWHAAAFCGRETAVIVSDDPVPPVGRDETVKGGAYTVQRQTVEPFGAFVYGRLGVNHPETIESGISPGLRGNIVHGALCALFAECPSQADIRAWGDAGTSQRLGSAIDSVLAEHLQLADKTLTRLLGIERTRLYRLLRSFLDEEIARPEYRIMEVEKSVVSRACGVGLSLRIDRIDRLPDGSLLIIDYKTGTPKNLLNRDGDPLDLQLVVYAEALGESVVESVGEPIGGLALINLDSRAISYRGTGGSVEWDVARQEQWPERLAEWRAEVQRALRQIAAGDARINLQLAVGDERPLSILSRIEEYKRAH